MSGGEHIIVLHGILRSSRHMRPMARFLQAQGYVVHNLDYPSTKQPLETLTEAMRKQVAECSGDAERVHFVAHSMGGLLVRALLAAERPPTLGRVVQLGTPNRGSEVADFLRNNWLYKKVFGPAGQQLVTDAEVLATQLGEVDFPLGVIAGNRSVDPISSLLIEGEDDGKVGVERTRVEGMHDHIVLPVSHVFMPHKRQVQEQTLHFLRHGAFAHSDVR
ncbi:MAG: hypothetical protein CMM94_04175 [Rickettsiales bacterium]|nr:hypothetical protein [Rickettsiales bacterium]|tara:strand:+ start:1080 stop:1736 length:657 start_codon:yes stop_codon:yes gene_type:complete